MKKSTVSVIINCLNGSKYLREAIDSVYAQTYNNWEIIFWDNASTDNSFEIAKSYDNRLQYFRGDKTVPLYSARNFALKQATGKYVAFLDCDDMWLPNKLELQVGAFENKMSLGLIHTNAEILEQNGSKRILHPEIQPSGKIFRDLLRAYNINMQTVMISAEALTSVGYCFDESMLFSGDADLFLRIAHDWELLYMPDITARYREHGGSLTAKKIETLIIESEKIIQNLSGKYINLNYEYRKELKSFRKRVQLSVIVAKWKYTGGEEARKTVIKNISSSNFLLYPLTFLPYEIVHFIWYRLLKGNFCINLK